MDYTNSDPDNSCANIPFNGVVGLSFVRASEKMRFSEYDDALYAFLGKKANDEYYIEDYGDLRDPEAFCEIVFRVLHQSDVDVDLEMVNKVRDRIGLDELDEIGSSYEETDDFKEAMDRIDEEFEDE